MPTNSDQHSLLREAREGTRLLRGEGRFTGDVALPGALALHFLRSPVATARITALDTDNAAAIPGVHAIHTGRDVCGLGVLPVNPVLPMTSQPAFPLLAGERIAAIGQPVAAILAANADIAADATDLIGLDFDETAEVPAHHPLARKHWRIGDKEARFAQAAQVAEARIEHPVLAPSSMEPRAIAVEYHPATQGVTVWHSTQTPHRSRSALAAILGMDPELIRVIAPDVGGAFGMKGSIYPEEAFAVWAALKHRRNVRWNATRSDEFLSATHGRGLTCGGRLALDDDGRFLALEARVDAPLGHWLPNSALIAAWNAARVLPGGYDIDVIDISTNARLTARPAMGLYRGAGRPEANMLMERLVEEAAQLTGTDPITIRRRNLLPAGRLPHDTATGNRLDSGNYAAALDLLRDWGGYDDALSRRDARRADGGLAGVGIGFYLEPSGEGWESARVTLTPDGRAEIASGSSAQGQFRTSAYRKIAAQALDLPVDSVSITYGDTGTCPEGIGALASRSTTIGGSAVLAACREVRARQEAGENGDITVETRYETEGQAWGFGVYMAELQIDPETGTVSIHRLTCVDDTGIQIDPDLVRGQIIGGAAQGMGEALMERIVFDADGQLLTGSFMDYALPRAGDMPPVDLHSTQTPSPMNLLGAKGVGEAGTIGAPIAIVNAALDALRPLGIRDLAMPLTPYRVWTAIRQAEKGDAE